MPVNVNTADLRELRTIHGVGHAIAQAIIRKCEEVGGKLMQEDIMSTTKIPATSWKAWIENRDMIFEPPLPPPQSPIQSTPASPNLPTLPKPNPLPKPPSSPAKSTSAKSHRSTSSRGSSLSQWSRLSERSQERIMDEISKHFEEQMQKLIKENNKLKEENKGLEEERKNKEKAKQKEKEE